MIACAASKIHLAALREYLAYEPRWSVADAARIYAAGNGIAEIREAEPFFSGIDKASIRAEMLAFPGISGLCRHLRGHGEILRIGNLRVPLVPSGRILHFVRGILSGSRNGPPSDADGWSRAISECERRIGLFLEGDRRDFDRIFFVAPSSDEDRTGAFGGSEDYRKTLERRYGSRAMADYSTGTPLGETLRSPEDFVRVVEEYVGNHPREKVLIHMGTHGFSDGSGAFSKGRFTKFHMDRLARIAESPNVTLDVMSCFSVKKFDKERNANLFLSSGNHDGMPSYRELVDAFRSESPVDAEFFRRTALENREDLALLNTTIFRGKPLLYWEDPASGIPPRITFVPEDLEAVVGALPRALNDSRLLTELLERSKISFPADFDGDGKVGLREAVIFRMLRHQSNLLPASFFFPSGG